VSTNSIIFLLFSQARSLTVLGFRLYIIVTVLQFFEELIDIWALAGRVDPPKIIIGILSFFLIFFLLLKLLHLLYLILHILRLLVSVLRVLLVLYVFHHLLHEFVVVEVFLATARYIRYLTVSFVEQETLKWHGLSLLFRSSLLGLFIFGLRLV